jgi:hypothetical protein
LDEISQGPKRDFRLPSARWLAVAAVGLAAVITTLVVTGGGGRHAAARRTWTSSRAHLLPVPLVVPVPAQGAAPGTVLLTCDSANWGQLAANWRAVSLQAGPLWFAYGRQQGYVHDGGWQGAGRTPRQPGKRRLGVMIVEVRSGSMVVMKPAATARPYFRFVEGFGPGLGYKLPAGDTGFTFAACPRGSGGPNGQVTDFYLGFSMDAGRAAPVEVWPSAMPRPIRVIFTCPGRGCAG